MNNLANLTQLVNQLFRTSFLDALLLCHTIGHLAHLKQQKIEQMPDNEEKKHLQRELKKYLGFGQS
jgi:hypothetical protein